MLRTPLVMKSSVPLSLTAMQFYGFYQPLVSRYQTNYFAPFPGYYFSGDGARRDADGCYWITGRVDDVINVSGHR